MPQIQKNIKIFDFKIFADKLSAIKLNTKPCIINTINAYSYVLTKSDNDFKLALQQSNILLPDGFPIVMAAKLIKKTTIYKIAGADIFYHLCNLLDKKEGKCFFLGATANTLIRISQKLSVEYPSIETKHFSPPFKQNFSTEDNLYIINAINTFNPDILFVGMTAPKQEKWVNENKNSMNVPIICSIGAVFDFYAGTTKRPSSFWVWMKLEWFIRFIKEPRRLWKRYLIYSPIFFVDTIILYIKTKIHHKF